MSLDFDSIPRVRPLRQSGVFRVTADRSQSTRVSSRSRNTKSSTRSKKTNPKQSKIQPKSQPTVSGKQSRSSKSSRKQSRAAPKLNADDILKRIGLASASLSKSKKSRSSRRRRNGAKQASKKAAQPKPNNSYFNQDEAVLKEKLDADLNAYYSNNTTVQNAPDVQPQEAVVPTNQVTPMEQAPVSTQPEPQQTNVTNMGELVAPQQVQWTLC